MTEYKRTLGDCFIEMRDLLAAQYQENVNMIDKLLAIYRENGEKFADQLKNLADHLPAYPTYDAILAQAKKFYADTAE